MPREQTGLTSHKPLKDSTLKALRSAPAGKRLTVWDTLFPGMCVRVTDKGARTFYAVKRREGAEGTNPDWVKLGAYPRMTLAEARNKAREAMLALGDGRDYRAERRAAARAAVQASRQTFEKVADEYLAYLAGSDGAPRESSMRMYRIHIKHALAPLATIPVAEITRRDVVDALETAKKERGAATARGAKALLGAILERAAHRELIAINPAAGISAKLLFGKPAAPRDRLLTDAEAFAIWIAAQAVTGPFATIYKLLMLLGLRREEIAGMRWDELQLDPEAGTGTFMFKAERAKNGLAQLVTLPPRAVALLAAIPRQVGPFVFSTTGGRRPVSAFSDAKERLDRAIAVSDTEVAPFHVHDLRRFVRSGLSALGVRNEVAEAIIGHKRRGIEGVYDLHQWRPEKAEALRRWEARLLSIVEPSPDDNVVALPARGRA
jgi:integrase